MKTLYLEKRGCDFFGNDAIAEKSDVGNHRVGIYDYSIKGKDGNYYILEFMHTVKRVTRKRNYKTGKALLKPVYEIVNNNALVLDTCFENGVLGSYRNLKLERQIFTMDFSYTLDNILAVVNYISAETYTEIQFI